MGTPITDLGLASSQFESNVTERSRGVEKEWFEAALQQAEVAIDAFAIYDDWLHTSGVQEREPLFRHDELRRSVNQVPEALSRFGDPTAPDWRRNWRHRLTARAARARDVAPLPDRATPIA
jgi:hypothetical protein